MFVGIVMERLIIRHFYSRPHEDQILVTFGLGIVYVEVIRFFFGSLSKSVPAPSWVTGITNLGFMIYPTYRLAVIGIVAVALIALYLVLYRTRLRSEEHTSELQSLMRISYAVFCLKKKK